MILHYMAGFMISECFLTPDWELGVDEMLIALPIHVRSLFLWIWIDREDRVEKLPISKEAPKLYWQALGFCVLGNLDGK